MEGAVARMRAALPADTLGLSALATMKTERGDRAGAVRAWEAILSVEPDNIEALKHLAEHWADEGNARLACAAIRRVLAQEDPAVSRRLGKTAGRLLAVLGPMIGRDSTFFEDVLRHAKKSDRQWRKWAGEYLTVHGGMH